MIFYIYTGQFYTYLVYSTTNDKCKKILLTHNETCITKILTFDEWLEMYVNWKKNYDNVCILFNAVHGTVTPNMILYQNAWHTIHYHMQCINNLMLEHDSVATDKGLVDKVHEIFLKLRDQVDIDVDGNPRLNIDTMPQQQQQQQPSPLPKRPTIRKRKQQSSKQQHQQMILRNRPVRQCRLNGKKNEK